MPNCRSISPETWAQARKILIFYFSRRHGCSDAEDLAHEVLLAVWNKTSYEFANQEEFFRACYGFAKNFSLAHHRKARRDAAVSVSIEMQTAIAAPQHQSGSQRATESKILLGEALRIGQSQLNEKQWETITQAAANHPEAPRGMSPAEANKARVRRFRVRRKFADLIGWGKNGV